MQLLGTFEGAEETRPLYKSIIGKAQGDDGLLRRVSAGLEATGIVSGQFGTVEAYKERRTAVAQWIEDGDEK
ncbi:MAG TPA: hypothetical protein DCM14_01030, partial [Clostridiales bacterium UBA8153]|nr:hypothetical protein [Clostridiales bacterium UBA8153]